jgi:hypothetical protein
MPVRHPASAQARNSDDPAVQDLPGPGRGHRIRSGANIPGEFPEGNGRGRLVKPDPADAALSE